MWSNYLLLKSGLTSLKEWARRSCGICLTKRYNSRTIMYYKILKPHISVEIPKAHFCWNQTLIKKILYGHSIYNGMCYIRREQYKNRCIHWCLRALYNLWKNRAIPFYFFNFSILQVIMTQLYCDFLTYWTSPCLLYPETPVALKIELNKWFWVHFVILTNRVFSLKIINFE